MMMLATPRTWVVGEVVTAAQLNTEIRDQFAALIAAAPEIVKSGDTGRPSTTTLAADPHLALAVAANATYAVEGFIDYDGAFGAGGLKIDFTLPASATMRWGLLGNVVSDINQKASTNTTDQTGNLSVGTYGTGGTHTHALLSGHLTTAGTAGTMTLRWAQSASNATATTVYAKSRMRLRRIT
ncbi:hypothetical protein ACFQ7B_07500 [Streptomyces erythrochromogenes]|uniref:hypothetical protein n=1 Tax=Streptomyces erythrochromogenes TaxID=285574 RepID=UPI0036787BE0